MSSSAPKDSVSKNRSLEQRRAHHALNQVNAHRGKTDNFCTSYRAYVDRLGPTILMNGLGQALASERSAAGADPKDDDKKAHGALYDAMQNWLCGEGNVYAKGNLLAALMSGSQEDYLRAQAEAMAWLQWHKKFARAAFLKGKNNESEA